MVRVRHDWVKGARDEEFHVAVQRAPAGVGSSVGGAESGVEEESVEANAVVARKEKRVRSFIVMCDESFELEVQGGSECILKKAALNVKHLSLRST